jgi:hypothetical protein
LIKRHDLIVNNDDYQPIRWRKNCKSIIDLTLSTHTFRALTAWGIESDLATTSDHEVIVFAWMPLRATAASEERQ